MKNLINYNSVVCAIAKNENLYINEWANYYLNLGFDHIFIFDNNNTTTPFIGDFIDKTIQNKITIFNKQNIQKTGFQLDCYQEFYNNYNNQFNWCLYCDVDEFLIGISNINEFLAQEYLKKFNQIRIQWKLYGDDDIIERDPTKPVFGAFTRLKTSSLNDDLSAKGNLEQQGKSIIRGGLSNIIFTSVHFASILKRENLVLSCLPSGKPCTSFTAIKEDYTTETVFINHYMTKSLSEFITQKYYRGSAVNQVRSTKINYFWRINTPTAKKYEWLRKHNIPTLANKLQKININKERIKADKNNYLYF